MRKSIVYYGLAVIMCFFSCRQKVEEKDSIEIVPLYTYNVESKLEQLGITLKDPGIPKANYNHAVRSGNLIFMSGMGPAGKDGELISGKIGADYTKEEGYEIAKLVVTSQLSALKAEIGDLNKVVRIVKVLGMVNCTPDFKDQPAVINGFSDTLVEIFGERGRHARSAVGMGSLPWNIPVEIELIVEVQE